MVTPYNLASPSIYWIYKNGAKHIACGIRVTLAMPQIAIHASGKVE
jgi:hypothetical protein